VLKSGVALLEEDDRVVKFIEKPSAGQIISDLVNTGIYVFEPRILGYITGDCCCDFGKDVFDKVINAREKLFGFVLNAKLLAIDTPVLYKKVVSSGERK